MGRFINSDSVAYLGRGKELVNYNLFAYCSNNPVNRVDYAGTKDEDHDGDEDSSTETNDSCITSGISLGGGGGGNGNGSYGNTSTGTTPKSSGSTNNGWTVGQDISTQTKAGNAPTWNTVRARYWKNEAYYNASSYSSANLKRMETGRAPLVEYQSSGTYYAMELHHLVPQREGGANSYDNLVQVTPWQHAEIDKFRHFTPYK